MRLTVRVGVGVGVRVGVGVGVTLRREACTRHGTHLAYAWQALAKMEALQLRMSEIERWFASVKAEAAGERQMRDQASKHVSKEGSERK